MLSLNAETNPRMDIPGSGWLSALLPCLDRLNDLIDGVRVNGAIRVGGHDIYAPDVGVIELRKRIGRVVQKSNPFPKPICDIVAYGLKIQGAKKKTELDHAVEQSLRRSALWDKVKDRFQSTAPGLSGGQQQRPCIARAIAMKPESILMDEPASALDPIVTARIEDLILELKRDFTIVIVTHSVQQAARISEDTPFIYIGELIEFGATKKIFTSPGPKRTEDYVTGRFG